MSIKFPNIKHFLSLFLAAVMMVSLLAVNAHAASINGAPIEAQRSGFDGERRNSAMSELSPSGGSERYGACDAAGDAAQYLGRDAFFNLK